MPQRRPRHSPMKVAIISGAISFVLFLIIGIFVTAASNVSTEAGGETSARLATVGATIVAGIVYLLADSHRKP